ncbi:hypothetical protein GIB67_008289 [Kingdonia uniflora]|uniref:Glutathione S-transferase n=1 Tax=Kingdonia uniflora TaxID=39325 RepID=A0A7J7N574_9MAGN|nr:hypothetical protein GIB67_008289 [Kingdonia uniflora]
MDFEEEYFIDADEDEILELKQRRRLLPLRLLRCWGFSVSIVILTLYYGFFMKVGEEQEKAVQEGLEILRNLKEYGLGSKKFFGGETIGLADVGLGWIAHWLDVLEEIVGIKLLEESKFPRLFEWMKNFKEISIIKENLSDRDEMMAILKSCHENIAATAHN